MMKCLILFVFCVLVGTDAYDRSRSCFLNGDQTRLGASPCKCLGIALDDSAIQQGYKIVPRDMERHALKLFTIANPL